MTSRDDEEPDFGSDEHLQRIWATEAGCEFCGHEGHRMRECPVRYEAYSDPRHQGRKKKECPCAMCQYARAIEEARHAQGR